MFTLSINSSGAFTASGKLAGKSVRFKGLFQPNGSAVASLGNNAPSAHLQLAGSGTSRSISGSLTGTSDILINATPVLGPATAAVYTVRMPHPDDLALPQGNGYGSLKISKAGTVSFSGKLGDGTKLTFSSPLLTGSAFPIYMPIYHNAGCVVGNAIFETSTDGDLDATLGWIKPETFSTSIPFFGSLYIPPARGETILSATAGNFVFGPDTQSVTITTKITPALPHPQKLKASVSTSTGIFSGTLIDPSTGKSTPFAGALFQDTNLGTGLIESKTNQSPIDFQP